MKTAELSIKTCRSCGAKAPICYPTPHTEECVEEEALCDLNQELWELDDDDEVVTVIPQVVT